MAKKDKKKAKKKKDSSGPDAVGAVRTAVERTFQATAEGAQSTRTRAQDLVDEVAGVAGRVREMVEQLGVLEDLKKQVDSLARRVQALEGGGSASKPAAPRKPAARKSSASRSTARKPAASRSTARKSTAKKPAARKPAASRATSSSSSSAPSKRSPAKKSS
jgi:hypothetical protein